MYHHIKKLMYTVNVGTPDPRFGNMLLEQFGGANGELAAAMQYSIQGLNCDDLERKDLLMDIGTEELSHLEIVGALARLHLKPMKFDRESAEADPLIAIAGGGGVSLYNSMGNACTAALESLKKPRFSIGKIPPTPGLVDQFFNDSTGVGEDGEIDARGPWNQGGEWQFVDAPAFQGVGSNGNDNPDSHVDDRTTSTTTEPELIEELLIEELRDLLSAEGQLVKALPKLAKAATAARLKLAFENHLEETREQVERLKKCFTLLGAQPKAKPCKGMAGLLEEGDEA